VKRKDVAHKELIDLSIQKKLTGLDELNLAIEKICEHRSMLIAKQARLNGQLLKLQRLHHYENARIWFRQGQYAYLHISQPGCKRLRTYIGTDVEKIFAIQEAIEIGSLVSDIKSSLFAVDQKARCCGLKMLQAAFAGDDVTAAGKVKVSAK